MRFEHRRMRFVFWVVIKLSELRGANESSFLHMILILKPDIDTNSREYKRLENHVKKFPNVEMRVHHVHGAQQVLTEVYLIGNTSALSLDEIKSFPAVDHAVRVSEEYRVLGRHKDDNRPNYFSYNGVEFSQDNLNIFAGLCAVDSPRSLEEMMKALQENGQGCTRMGAYKPRTSP